jgi:hypothetical protein
MISAVVLVEVGAQKNGLPEARSIGNPALHSLLENAIHSELDEIICVVRGLALLRPQLAVADEKLFWLLDYGADPNIADARGVSPLDAALAADESEIIVALKRHGAR